MEQHGACRHDDARDDTAHAEGFKHALFVARAVIVADDRRHALAESEYGHKDKALELEVDTEGVDIRRGVLSGDIGDRDDRVDARYHDRADALHDDRGETDSVDIFQNELLHFKALERDLDLMLSDKENDQDKGHGADLTEHGRDRRAENAELREKPDSEDQQGSASIYCNNDTCIDVCDLYSRVYGMGTLNNSPAFHKKRSEWWFI